MIKALLRVFDWHYNRDPAHTHSPIRAVDLARQFQVKPAAVRQALAALDYRPVKFKSRFNGVVAYREWWWPPGAVITRPRLGRPYGALGTALHSAPAQELSDNKNPTKPHHN